MINLKELKVNKIFLGAKHVQKIFFYNTVVYPVPDIISVPAFHRLVPTSATEIKFLYTSDNPDLTDYQRIGYCDNNNFIEVWNSGTKYIIINPRKNYIYAPVNCSSFLANYTALNVCIFDNFDTRNTTSMQSMFHQCSSLTSLDVSNFYTKNVTTLQSMFNGCRILSTIDLSNFNTENVTNMSYIFLLCNNLTSVNLSNFNTQKLTDMNGMFHSCNSLTSLDMRSFNTKNVYYMIDVFYNCNRLTTIISTTFNRTAVGKSTNMFGLCTSLVGGNGTTYNSSHITAEYARVDGEGGLPGYFTAPATS